VGYIDLIYLFPFIIPGIFSGTRWMMPSHGFFRGGIFREKQSAGFLRVV
jgi:hypothetical protein